MKRKLLCGLLTAALLVQPAFGARRVQVQVDGNLLSDRSYVEQGTTYVPLRSLLDAFGGWETYWDPQLRSAVSRSADDNILTADPAANTISIDGTVYSGRVTVEFGRTYVPLRLVVQALGGTAAWDAYLDGAAVTSPGADHDAESLYWLSRIISAESRGEPLEGQIAVGNVVMNRLANPIFPDTIKEVLAQKNQFSTYKNGRLANRTPNASSVIAAKLVLDGGEVEETLGALYFDSRKTSWASRNKECVAVIGGHKFFK